jgi:hypothetical protein
MNRIAVFEGREKMTLRGFVITGVAALALTAGLRAQTPTTTGRVQEAAGAAQVVTEQITGEVVLIDGNWLLARLQPTGQYRAFNIPPKREFRIDGATRYIGDLKPGTTLIATATTTTQPITVRTTTVTNGTVWYVSGNTVIVTFENGDHRTYTVPESYKFTVEGKQASVSELRKGMKVSATKIVEEPRTEISTTTVITGKAPK